MVQPPGQPRRKRRARHTAAIAPRAPPAGALEEDGFGDGNAATQKRIRTAHPPPLLLPPQDMVNIINEPPPLGLQLKKSPSFVDLVRTCLSKANSTTDRSAMKNVISNPPLKKDIKSRALTTGERLKASNFPANFLKIGNWEYTSQYEGDLVAKCYYAKHKLVWEVLNDGLKSKIELQWSHITALNATCPKEGDGTLDLMLSRPPIFFQETDPQPRKHTLWQAAADFTGGQASMYRRHILRCSSSLLSRNFEKLIQCDQRLNELSRQPIIMLDSLYFETRSSIFKNPNESDDPSSKFAHHVSPCDASLVFERDAVKHHQPLGVQAKIVAQEQKNLNLCNEANTEVSKEFLEIAESLLSDTHGPPSADEKYLMARVDSFGSWVEKDTTPSTVSIPEHNDIIIAGEASYDDFDEELRFCFKDKEQWAPAGRTVDGGIGPPAISRKDSLADLLENLPRIASMSQFLFDIAED